MLIKTFYSVLSLEYDVTLSKDTDTNENNSPSRQNVLDIIESFINGIVVIRRTLVGFSLSALFLAPFAIALSLYLMFHPSFFSVLQGHGDFGMYLVMLPSFNCRNISCVDCIGNQTVPSYGNLE